VSDKPVTVFSCVGGGPMERLVDHLRARGRAATLVTEHEPMAWRRLVADGRLGRLRARASAMLRFPLRALGRALRPESGTLVPTTNPFFLPAFLVATKAIHGRPVVALIYDLYPDALEATGAVAPRSIPARLAAAANRFLFAEADGVVFIGDRMSAHARVRYGQPRRHSTLPTGAATAELARVGSSLDLDEWIGDRILASYVGHMGHVHDWKTLQGGIAQLVRSNLEVAVVIAASGPGLEALRRELPPGCERWVRLLPPQSDAAWRDLLARTDIALVTLRESARHTSVPSKTFSAMAAGAAILAIAPRDSDLGDVVAGADCGAVVQPGNSIQLFDALSRMVRDPGVLSRMQANATAAARDRYELEVLAADWDRFLAEVERYRRPGVGYGALKRLLDVGAAGLGVVALAPVMLTVGAAVRATMGPPALFRQSRPGYLGRPFELIKFRSMRGPRPGEDGAEHDAARLTRLGRWLRATSLDELPALLNVLRGEMSLVGPRPLMTRYLRRYTPRQMRRHDVPPGITGQAQVRGRNALSWPEKFEHDLWYVENRSLWIDLKILAATIAAVLRRADISQPGHATMPEFRGERTG
jgi:lipopolysaccharide/colanic/teichoic acid biosynthesis glycosyltransferase